MKIAITGVNSFIGGFLVERLLKEGHELFGFTQNKDLVIPGVTLWNGNLKNYVDVEAWVEAVKPDIMIHLAAKTEVALSFDDYLDVSIVNYVGTVNLAEACRKFVPNFKLFLMASTMETYGWHDPKDGAFTEDTKQRPRAPYAVAKLACEAYLRYMFFSYDFPFCALRQTNAYGRTDNDFFVVEHIITQMLKSQTECNLGEPDAWRNFIHIDDLIDLYTSVINNVDKVKGEFFVTGPDNVLLIRDLAEIIKQKLNWQGQINWHTKPKRPGEIFYLNSNPAKAKSVFGWEPKISLSEGLDRTIEVWRSKYASEAKEVRPQ